MILAIDTTGQGYSMALGESSKNCAKKSQITRQPDEKLYSAMEALLKKRKAKLKDISAVVVAVGPGRFTGIRIGLVFGEMLAASLKKPILGVTHFEAFASAVDAETAKDWLLVLPGHGTDRFLQRLNVGPKGGKVLGKPEYSDEAGFAKALACHRAKGSHHLVESELASFGAETLIDAALDQLGRGRPRRAFPLYLKPASYEVKK